MAAKKGDRFTMMVGVARDENKMPSKEAFKKGREIVDRLEAQDAKRAKPKKKGASGTPRQQISKDTLLALLKDKLKGGE